MQLKIAKKQLILVTIHLISLLETSCEMHEREKYEHTLYLKKSHTTSKPFYIVQMLTCLFNRNRHLGSCLFFCGLSLRTTLDSKVKN